MFSLGVAGISKASIYHGNQRKVMTNAYMGYYYMNLEQRLLQARLFKSAPSIDVMKVCWNIMEIRPKARQILVNSLQKIKYHSLI